MLSSKVFKSFIYLKRALVRVALQEPLYLDGGPVTHAAPPHPTPRTPRDGAAEAALARAGQLGCHPPSEGALHGSART